MTVYCGREFSPEDIQTIKLLMEHHPSLKRRPLSRKVCERLGWLKPSGELKDMTCRVAMLRMHADGLITLPPAQSRGLRVKPHFPPTTATDPQTPLIRPVHELGALRLCPITDTASSHLWNEFIARYHYLGYTPMSGSQMRYNVFAGHRQVALLSFGASAWRLAGRERFIGWQEPERLRNLQLVVNNARFLILPWIQSKGLASKILSRLARQLPVDWHQRYGYAPVLLETFVEVPHFSAISYQAAAWIRLGETQGRGKLEKNNQQVAPLKEIWIYPLHPRFRQLLCAAP